MVDSVQTVNFCNAEHEHAIDCVKPEGLSPDGDIKELWCRSLRMTALTLSVKKASVRALAGW